jgi:hypothetical protein
MCLLLLLLLRLGRRLLWQQCRQQWPMGVGSSW